MEVRGGGVWGDVGGVGGTDHLMCMSKRRQSIAVYQWKAINAAILPQTRTLFLVPNAIFSPAGTRREIRCTAPLMRQWRAQIS